MVAGREVRLWGLSGERAVLCNLLGRDATQVEQKYSGTSHLQLHSKILYFLATESYYKTV